MPAGCGVPRRRGGTGAGADLRQPVSAATPSTASPAIARAPTSATELFTRGRARPRTGRPRQPGARRRGRRRAPGHVLQGEELVVPGRRPERCRRQLRGARTRRCSTSSPACASTTPPRRCTAHPNCDCGAVPRDRQLGVHGVPPDRGRVRPLPRRNVDFGGGLERIAAAAIDSPDVYRISLLRPIVDRLAELAGTTLRAEHVRAAGRRRPPARGHVPRR